MSGIKQIRLALMIALVAILAAGHFGLVDASTGAPIATSVIAYQDTVDDTADDVGTELQEPTPFENWQILLAFVMPGIVEFFRGLTWSDRQKMIVSFGITAAVTTVSLFLQGQLDLSVDYITTVLKVFALTIPAYYGMWKPLGLAGQTGKTYGLK